MKNIRRIVWPVVIMVLLLGLLGCSKDTTPENNVAFISANENLEYEKVYKELGLGVLYDFDFKLPYADQSWVNIWVEGYQNGQKMDPFHLIELSYGKSPQQVEEGHMGFGLINPISEAGSIFMYSHNVKAPPIRIDNQILNNSASFNVWDYAIGSEKVSLESGETKLLAVYRQGKNNTIEGFDYQDSQAMDKMIKKDAVVLLLKVKVVKEDEAEGDNDV
ncbi:hypothetical protein MNQ98_20685 [Paenibacillus sp. N3/727]|uniref:hypothetical protein n=1 Tax=Paenibacillus sp. N3/727 TaxID=2925845 RepID=UPI001F52BF2E|nr:hypothetical protein [Paenibacillus sp. N3/727]UNK16894.1 hypothetical protein MNQ98_20685 [Paenibacillus sp. N3/727]